MTYSLSITPGQAIVRQLPHSSSKNNHNNNHNKHHQFHFLDNLPLSEWYSFCDSYDAIVVTPYRRAKYAMVAAFMIALLVLMATLTLTESDPTGTLFLMGPGVFGIVAVVAAVYMFRIYPQVSLQLETLCQETSKRLAPYNIQVHYQHNDARHDLKDHVIILAPIVQDIETAVPAATMEWNPLLQLRSLWGGGTAATNANKNYAHHDH